MSKASASRKLRPHELPVTLLMLAALAGCNSAPRVLLFSHTAGFRHESIPAARAAIVALGAKRGFQVDTTEDVRYLTEDSLRHYSAVIFLHTTGELLDQPARVDLQRFIPAGGGFVGILAAADALYGWRWYGALVGGSFESHPAIQPARLAVTDHDHPMTRHLPDTSERTDEWYNFKRLAPDLQVLLTIDEASYEGGTNGPGHPMTWYHEFDGGRSWYTALGHTDESYQDPNFLTLLANGIRWATDGPALDYGKARTARAPAQPGLRKTMLVQGEFTEPTEMAVLPNGDVVVVERRGRILRYRVADGSLAVMGEIPVYWRTNVEGVNAEEGLLGVTADPGFADNHYLYLFYSPAGPSSVNRLSRFTLGDDSLLLGSEKVILELYSQRQICCHTGGSLAFGPDGNLYLSTGDNSTPFDVPDRPIANHGFAPLDNRPGLEQYDARRSSANTNDLRGKVIRIRVEPDGSYTIPEGNLFPPGTPNTRPEIYAMGTRNAYRLTVDPVTGFVYWGDIGPDADADSLDTRGPRGYDEINQARGPGFFGWPLFIGENEAYRRYDYRTGESGPAFDPAHPINESAANTGLRDLPPARPAFIWYPYADSPDFPEVGSGGRTLLAGPVFRADRYPEATRLPRYYDGKLFIYDWLRHWIKAVTLTASGDYEAMEPFLPDVKLASPIDLELGPDGSLYLLEYGIGWFSQNPDAGLSRIEPDP